MENFENDLYICLKDKEGNYFPFYNIKGTFSNNMKGGGNNSVEIISNLLNFDQFNKNVKEALNNSESKPNEVEREHEMEKILKSEIEEEGGGKEYIKIEEEKDNIINNSMLPEDFADFFKKQYGKFL